MTNQILGFEAAKHGVIASPVTLNKSRQVSLPHQREEEQKQQQGDEGNQPKVVPQPA